MLFKIQVHLASDSDSRPWRSRGMGLCHQSATI